MDSRHRAGRAGHRESKGVGWAVVGMFVGVGWWSVMLAENFQNFTKANSTHLAASVNQKKQKEKLC